MEIEFVLPFELWIEILSWLPVKTLMRFSCVSKSWKSLIYQDRDFKKLHLDRSPKNNNQVILTLQKPLFSGRTFFPFPVRRLLQDQEPSSSSIIDDIPFEEEDEDEEDNYHDTIGSCNGLVCLYGINDHGLWFRLWNPATRFRFHKSPPLDAVIGSTLHFAFGYDHSRDTYKVVVLCSIYYGRRLGGQLLTMVHCIGDSCWRQISRDPGLPVELDHTNGLFVGGCVNWVALDDLQRRIVSFDIHDETYQSLSLPKEYGVPESWTRMLSISYQHFQCNDVILRHRWLVCLCGDGNILMLAKDEGGLVIIFNLSDNSVKYIKFPQKDFGWVLRIT
ncbi:F-box/kelch-repeat protein At3g23880-like isoform X2 [Lotus japonicus]|uniref:F-box/kelch-repeat protein At3g23880-like isoform X2 n=1 Tax=Lotus japonicus TaxID=34305 RepID=UPI002589E05B|nr:F-box/kelch-repeat protein At3g23880-like isoform X2 [Lotus japonicus]